VTGNFSQPPNALVWVAVEALLQLPFTVTTITTVGV
jgi:hypothetical protein